MSTFSLFLTCIIIMVFVFIWGSLFPQNLSLLLCMSPHQNFSPAFLLNSITLFCVPNAFSLKFILWEFNTIYFHHIIFCPLTPSRPFLLPTNPTSCSFFLLNYKKKERKMKKANKNSWSPCYKNAHTNSSFLSNLFRWPLKSVLRLNLCVMPFAN